MQASLTLLLYFRLSFLGAALLCLRPLLRALENDRPAAGCCIPVGASVSCGYGRKLRVWFVSTLHAQGRALASDRPEGWCYERTCFDSMNHCLLLLQHPEKRVFEG